MDIVNNTLVIPNPAAHINDWSELKYYWYADLYRYTGRKRPPRYLHDLLRNHAFKFTFLLRLCAYLYRGRRTPGRRLALRFFYEILRYYSVRYGLEIAHITPIGCGLYLPHPQGIVVHEAAVIGKNCVISQGVTIGDLKRGEKKGVPVIGDNVYIAPGAVVVGHISVGNNVAVGANSVVNQDLPDNAVAAGVPAKILSYKGSAEYINNVDY